MRFISTSLRRFCMIRGLSAERASSRIAVANDVSINETAAAKCRVDALQRVREKEPAAATPCWGGLREAARLARLVEIRVSKHQFSAHSVLSPGSSQSSALDPRIAIDRGSAWKETANPPFNGEPSAIPRTRNARRSPAHSPTRGISI